MKRILAGCAIALAGVLGFAAPANAAHQPYMVVNGTNPDLNKTSFYENHPQMPQDAVCVKVEFGNGVTSRTVQSGTYALVLKAGTQYTIYKLPTAGTPYYPQNGKDISFAITCAPGGHTPPPPPVS